MSALIVQNGLSQILMAYTSIMSSGFTVGLYSSPHTPTVLDLIGTYTAIESNWSGYTRQPITTLGPPTWNSTYYYSPTNALTWEWTVGGSTIIYGYFVIDSSGQLFQASNLWGGGYSPSTSSPEIQFQIQFTSGNCT